MNRLSAADVARAREMERESEGRQEAQAAGQGIRIGANRWTRCMRRIKADPRWRYFELQTGHNLYYSAPRETVAILPKLAGRAAVGQASR